MAKDMEKEIVVEPVPAAPGYYAYAKDFEERYGTTWGETPEKARAGHQDWMELIDGK